MTVPLWVAANSVKEYSQEGINSIKLKVMRLSQHAEGIFGS